MRSLPSYEPRGVPLIAWLFRIAHNQAVNYMKKTGRRRETPLTEAQVTYDGLEEEVLERARFGEVVQAMDELTDLQRQVLNLRFAGELSIAEAARVMNRQEGAVKSLQLSALRALRRIWDRQKSRNAMDDKLQEIVQESLELLRHGGSIEECLDRYPEAAEELEPILHASLIVQEGLQPNLEPDARRRMRTSVLTEWDRRGGPGRWRLRLPSLFVLPRWAVAAASLVIALVLGGIWTDTAAADSVPGDLLYPIKEFREDVQTWFARSPEAKVETYTRLVKERVEEVQEAAAREQADIEAISAALARLDGHLAALTGVVDREVPDAGSEDASVDTSFMLVLQESARVHDATEDLLGEALEGVPVEIPPTIGNAIEAIQRAQQRVDSALEALGPIGDPNDGEEGE